MTAVRIEVTTATGAERGLVLANQAAKEVDYATPSGVSKAITEKLKHEQLTSEEGRMAGVPKEGVLAVHTPRRAPAVNLSPEQVARSAMENLAQRLRSRVELSAIEFFLPDGSVLRYNRRGNVYVPMEIRLSKKKP